MNSVIQVENLGKSFGTTRALDGVDLAVRRGTVLGLLGPNGSGKTTTVRVLATLLRPDSGRARVLGHDVVAEPEAVRARIGLTGQYAAVDEALSGTDNIVLVARLLGLSRREARIRAAELIARFGLADAAGRRVRTYSGGMRRRLDLAVSLVGRPDVLFLDEPTTGLDPRHRNEVWDEVRALAVDGTTVLLNPVSKVADAARGLLTGGAVAGPATASLLASAVLVAVFGPLAVALYRRRT